MSNANLSAREYAEKYINARSAKARSAVREAVAAKAGVSKRKRWASLLAAIDAGDNARVRAFAALGEAKREAWAAVRKPAKQAAPKAKAPAKRKAPARKAAKQPEGVDPNALVKQLASMDDEAFAAFFNAVAQARVK